MEEIFKEIFVEDGLKKRYAISNKGNLISFKYCFTDGRILKLQLQDGYRIWRYRVRCQFTKKIKYRHQFVHHLVALYHIGEPCNNEIIHLDRDRANNKVSNLRYVNKEEWWNHWKESSFTKEMLKNNFSKTTHISNRKLSDEQIDDLRKALALGEPRKSIADLFGISENHVYRIQRGECWSKK